MHCTHLALILTFWFIYCKIHNCETSYIILFYTGTEAHRVCAVGTVCLHWGFPSGEVVNRDCIICLHTYTSKQSWPYMFALVRLHCLHYMFALVKKKTEIVLHVGSDAFDCLQWWCRWWKKCLHGWRRTQSLHYMFALFVLYVCTGEEEHKVCPIFALFALVMQVVGEVRAWKRPDEWYPQSPTLGIHQNRNVQWMHWKFINMRRKTLKQKNRHSYTNT